MQGPHNSSQQTVFAAFFGMVVAVILLVLYAWTMLMMVQVVQCEVSTSCSSLTVKDDITDGMIFVNTTVGGLVAALVVAQLAITEPGKTPGARLASAASSRRWQAVINIVSALYVAVWIVIGLVALIYGVILHQGISETLTTSGTTWLGLAVAAGYSYFGLEPQG